MPGVPIKKADVYVNRLLKKGYKVAICDQLQDPCEAKEMGECLLQRWLPAPRSIAGKGHERTQVFADREEGFNDRAFLEDEGVR